MGLSGFEEWVYGMGLSGLRFEEWVKVGLGLKNGFKELALHQRHLPLSPACHISKRSQWNG